MVDGDSMIPAVVYGFVNITDFTFTNAPLPVVVQVPVSLPSTSTVFFGQDTYDLTDLPTIDNQVIGTLLIGLRLARRLQTDYGALALIGGDPDFGFNIGNLVNAKFGKNDILITQVQIEQECLKDEQVQSVACAINTSELGIYNISIAVQSSDGPFQLTIPISDVTYQIIFQNSEG